MVESIQEKWIKGVVITTTCLAVMTAIAAARGAACSTKTQILTAAESSKWAYYQAKSIKQNLAESQVNAFEVEALGAVNAQQQDLYASKLKAASEEISRYNAEKNQIRKDAEDAASTNHLIAKKANFFSAAVVFFQIAIMLSSVSALLKKKFMWVLGLLFGMIAAVLLGYGLFLQPLLF
ncbi:MAG TPA: DUF4337 domain-containing protein [Candidatus Omnitrophota bacterium]|nr:DUF4337 domain-containing protein [Candidatus Omnitrophota bacterium]HPT39941.1 DUF4337 domain-containing protein [Candidatus Omnitrophota bacterium]